MRDERRARLVDLLGAPDDRAPLPGPPPRGQNPFPGQSVAGERHEASLVPRRPDPQRGVEILDDQDVGEQPPDHVRDAAQ